MSQVLWFSFNCDLGLLCWLCDLNYWICHLFVISPFQMLESFSKDKVYFTFMISNAIFQICYLWFSLCYSKVIALHRCGMQGPPTARTNLNVSFCHRPSQCKKSTKSTHVEIYLNCTYRLKIVKLEDNQYCKYHFNIVSACLSPPDLTSSHKIAPTFIGNGCIEAVQVYLWLH